MGVREVTYHIAFCDCCKEDAEYGDYSAWADHGDAVPQAEKEFEQIGDELLCPACWYWPEDLPDYPGDEAWQGTDDAVKRPNRHPANSDQSGEHKAEMIGACRLTTPHDRHDWHYSYTGYAECPGVPNQSDRS